MKSNWRVYTKKADFKAIGERFGIDQVMARIIRNRGLETYEQINMYLNGTVDDMPIERIECFEAGHRPASEVRKNKYTDCVLNTCCSKRY